MVCSLADVPLPASQRRLHGSFRVFHFRHNLAKGGEAGEDMRVVSDCVEEMCKDSRCNISKLRYGFVILRH